MRAVRAQRPRQMRRRGRRPPFCRCSPPRHRRSPPPPRLRLRSPIRSTPLCRVFPTSPRPRTMTLRRPRLRRLHPRRRRCPPIGAVRWRRCAPNLRRCAPNARPKRPTNTRRRSPRRFRSTASRSSRRCGRLGRRPPPRRRKSQTCVSSPRSVKPPRAVPVPRRGCTIRPRPWWRPMRGFLRMCIVTRYVSPRNPRSARTVRARSRPKPPGRRSSRGTFKSGLRW